MRFHRSIFCTVFYLLLLFLIQNHTFLHKHLVKALLVPYILGDQLGRHRRRIYIQFYRMSSANFPAILSFSTFTPMYIHLNSYKIQTVSTKKICFAAFDRSFETLSNGRLFLYDFIMINLEKVIINRSIFFSSFFAYFLPFVDVNLFTLLALKSKRIKLLSSAWWHFKDFFLALSNGH